MLEAIECILDESFAPVNSGVFNKQLARPILQALTDWAMDRDQKAELRSQFKNATYAYMREEDLLPKRAQIVSRLNELAGLVSDRLDMQVVFR